MRKKALIISGIAIILIATFVIFWFAFLKPCNHEWVNPTCVTPMTCAKCGEIAGDPLGHNWVEATCEDAKRCSSCGLTSGEPLGHSWVDATCTVAKTCSVCGAVEGEPLGHDWIGATYDDPKTCATCGATEGEPLEPPYTPSYSSNSSSSGNSGGGFSGSESSSFKYRCSISGCPYPAKCVNGTYGSYCEFHGCRVPGCLNTPIGGSYYCATHINNY